MILQANRKGVALAAAILALVVIGALVTGGFYAASHESRVSMSSKFAGRAYYFAEQGVHRTLANVDRRALEDMDPGKTYFIEFQTGQSIDILSLDELLNIFTTPPEHSDTITVNGRPVGAFRATIRPMNAQTYWVRSEGEVVEGGRYSGAERAVGVTVRTTSIAFPANTAVQTGSPIDVSGNAQVDGTDHNPWDACPPGQDQAGIVTEDASTVTYKKDKHIVGVPEIEEQDLTNEDFTQFGDISFDDLADRADKIYPPGANVSQLGPEYTPDGSCDTSEQSNWGAPLADPDDPCHFYFPIIYAQGDIDISGHDAGQGILLVEGDLEYTGGGEFYGIVIVKGSFKVAGGGSHINGAVLTKGNADLAADDPVGDESDATGNAIINFSSCAIRRAAQYNSLAKYATPLERRAWVDLSAAGA